MSYTYTKRPIKSFQDLEVYQRLLAVSVAIAKRIVQTPDRASLHAIALDLPVKIAAAHSLRFSDKAKALQTLEEIMLNCNLLVVYLEQYRDIKNGDLSANERIEPEFFEEQIKTILTTRSKVLRLQFSWKKFSDQNYNQNVK